MAHVSRANRLRGRPAWVNWLFASRRNGRIVIVSWPNVPLWAFIFLTALRVAFAPHSALLVGAAYVAIIVWAAAEVGWGVNPFRRGLGLVVLVWELVSLALTFR